MRLVAALLGVGLLHGHQGGGQDRSADLILHNGRVWTVEASRPEARAVAVRGDRILAVGDDAEVLVRRGPSTQVVDLRGRLLLPGFIDAHTHFENAADWLFRVSLFDCQDTRELAARLRAAARRIPKGMWITGGDLGAFAAWEAERRGGPVPPLIVPSLAEIDAVTPDHPVLVRRHDYACFANSSALRRARLGPDTPDPRGGRIEKDPATGAPTGMLFGRAGERLAELMPPPSREQKLVGARAALEDLRRVGITSIHDVARLDDLSQRQVFPTHVERSFSDVAIFRELQRQGELTVRVYALLTLALWKEIGAAGIRPRTDEGMIRYGALKGFIDGFLMEEPYADDARYAGSFTFRFADEATMARDVAGADRSGFDPVVHTIGDKAHRLLLDWYEGAIRENPVRDRRFRIIHAWYPSALDVERAGRLRLIADVTPFHLVRGLGSLEKRLGPERSRTAFAWRSLAGAGVRLNLVSDWPGSYNEQDAVPLAPLENIQLAVTRAGWHPEEGLTVAEAIAAYTINPAYASYEEDRKGTIREGKLADLVLLSKDVLSLPPEAVRTAEVDLTILGGKVIYRRD